MLHVTLDTIQNRPPQLLFLGAHADDIEIGCAGTIAHLRNRYPDAAIHWMVFSATDERRDEVMAAAERLLGTQAGVNVKSFRDSFFPYQGAAIKETFEQLAADLQPDVIFTHARADRHQDHRQVNELTWNTFRNHLILEYEVPKYDGDLGQPNLYVPLTHQQVDAKLDLLMEVYATQRNRHWFRHETFQGLMAIRGVECRAQDGYAEAFFAHKLVLQG